MSRINLCLPSKDTLVTYLVQRRTFTSYIVSTSITRVFVKSSVSKGDSDDCSDSDTEFPCRWLVALKWLKAKGPHSVHVGNIYWKHLQSQW